ncbi:PREDICTED: MATH domain and coiled-coil domain-containing protein At1g31400-like [Camelina sativa]|uniref:MATH domain and coiled-coil domain-containing protein At1g31400-like n=1 Tax=Camelina sativa TaxID=90675 RepID=A0ABM1R797_CAMSA|nr:PREDICTED: MATH domain and coiled-coil domain-containing protein At1g31400-like [Camelina sativa]
MEKQYEKKITWTIKNFSSLQSEKIYSDPFVVGDSKWRLTAYPNGNGDSINKCLSLFLSIADSESLPSGWKRHAKYRLTVDNQISEKLSKQGVGQDMFDHKSPSWGLGAILPLTKLVYNSDGFLVNGEVKIVAEVGVLEVVGKSDVLEETLLVNESVECNGFQVLPSQVESVNSLFEEHPDIASKISVENPRLRTTYLNSLLTLSEILCQSPQKLSNNDLANAHSTLSYLTKTGFKLDWLEKKLKEAGETRLQQLEEELKDFKQKFS